MCKTNKVGSKTRDYLTGNGKLWRLGGVGAIAALSLTTSLSARFGESRWGLIGCPIRKLLGIPCPSCGMTRSFIFLARGDWFASFQYHAFGSFLLASLGLFGIHWIVELMRDRSYKTLYTSLFSHPKFQLFLVGIFFIYYGLRLTHIIPSDYL